MIIQNIHTSQGTQGALPAKLANEGVPAAVTGTAKHVSPQLPSAEQLKSAVNDLNRVMRQSSQNLEFIVDPSTKKPIVKMVDSQTGELIRQIPSEEMLAITRSIDRFLLQQQLQHGLLLTQKA